MFLAGLIACAITGILILVRIVLGKTTFDRILAVLKFDFNISLNNHMR